MGTSIVPGMSQVDQAFSSIYNMFGGAGGSGAGGIATGNLFGAPLTGLGSGSNFGLPQLNNPDNSTTGLWYGLANLAGQVGPAMTQEGGNLVNTGMGVTSGGLDMQGAGFGTTQAGLNTLQPAINFYQQLLSGNPAATTAALAPTANTLSNVYSGAVNQAGAGMPAGGYRAATLAGLPQAQAAQVGNAAVGLQNTAAQGLGQLGGEVAGIGGTQAGIGTGVSATGANIAQTGTTLTAQGLQTTQNLIADVLNKMGINYQYGGAQTFQTIATGLNQLV